MASRPVKRVRKPEPKQDNLTDKAQRCFKLHGLEKSSIQTLLEPKDLWAVTTGERTKPTKPRPPARNACWVQERAYRDACAAYKRSLKAWERKSPDAWVKIRDACEDGVGERIGNHRYGKIAWRILEGFWGATRWRPDRRHCPSGVLRSGDRDERGGALGQSVVELADHIETLAVKYWERVCVVPKWIVCLFFQVGLELEEEEERELTAEERRKGVVLRMGDMVGLLARHEKQVARGL
ncbi:MAG: hypothetical protein ALECFALPRED_002774 [Alectoria fallacina]|uniref:Uncharacterized protein n=1 Tax=Alectoria fallacina TaxID=1903189 RepID=A0A8H3FFW1_9LECA|nr:MAG: hypothetical protein ALECFALPRED_002774 [Alectoria fallacina]